MFRNTGFSVNIGGILIWNQLKYDIFSSLTSSFFHTYTHSLFGTKFPLLKQVWDKKTTQQANEAYWLLLAEFWLPGLMRSSSTQKCGCGKGEANSFKYDFMLVCQLLAEMKESAGSLHCLCPPHTLRCTLGLSSSLKSNFWSNSWENKAIAK